jgi:hypothetical protein
MKLTAVLSTIVLAAGVVLAVPAFAATPKKSVGRRLAHQQARINHLEARGKISPRTAARLQAQHNRLAAEAAARRGRHGRLSKRSRKHLQHQLNHSSAHISHHKG